MMWPSAIFSENGNNKRFDITDQGYTSPQLQWWLAKHLIIGDSPSDRKTDTHPPKEEMTYNMSRREERALEILTSPLFLKGFLQLTGADSSTSNIYNSLILIPIPGYFVFIVMLIYSPQFHRLIVHYNDLSVPDESEYYSFQTLPIPACSITITLFTRTVRTY